MLVVVRASFDERPYSFAITCALELVTLSSRFKLKFQLSSYSKALMIIGCADKVFLLFVCFLQLSEEFLPSRLLVMWRFNMC